MKCVLSSPSRLAAAAACLLAVLATGCPSRVEPGPPAPPPSTLPAPPQPSPPAPSPARAVADALGPILPAAPMRVAVDRVGLTGSPVAGPVAAYLRQLIVEAVSAAPGIEQVEEEGLDEVLEVILRTRSELYDRGSAPRLGRFKPPQALVEASYLALDGPPRLRLALRVRELETLASRSASCELPRAGLPAGLALEPSNAQFLNHRLAQWRDAVPGKAFPVEVWTDRGAGASYRPGEAVRIYVRSGEAGRVTVEHLDAAGAVTTVFPNAWHEDDRLAARRVLEIPDETMGFTLEAAGEGAELIRAVVTADSGERAQAYCGYRVEPGR